MSVSNLMKIQRIVKEVENIREESRSKNIVTTDLMLIILEIAKGNGVTGRDIEDLLGIGASKAQRLLDSLRDEQRSGARGYGLVEERPCPVDYRSIKRYPNARLQQLVKHIDEVMAD